MNKLQSKIYLAPFQGITGAVYREVYSRHFPYLDKLFTPFFTSIYKHKSLVSKVGELEQTHHLGIPVVPQVLSNNADEIIRFGNICYEMGFKEINWNLGCPFKRVAAKKRGSGLLPHPELVKQILEIAMAEIPIKLSVKCRLGYDSPTEIFELLPIFEDYGISELIIHARLGKQIYKGEVDIQTFDQVCEMSHLNIVYNGDIFSQADFQKYNSQFENIENWMIGRGLLVDPFLPSDIKEIETIDAEERKTLAYKFIIDLYLAYRKKLNNRLHAISLMKELWEYMSYSFDKPGKVFSKIKKTKSFDEYEDAVKKVFDDYYWVGSSAKQFSSSSI